MNQKQLNLFDWIWWKQLNAAIQPENGKFVDLVKAAKIIEELNWIIGLFKYWRTK